MMTWSEIVSLNFNRTILAREKTDAKFAPPPKPNAAVNPGGGLQSGTVRGDMARAVVARTLGIPLDSGALAPSGGLQSGSSNTTPSFGGQVTQVQVDCGNCGKAHCRHCEKTRHSLFDHGLFKPRRRPKIEQRAVFGIGALAGGLDGTPAGGEKPKPAGLGGLQSGTAGGGTPAILQSPVLNQPVLNQPRFNDDVSPRKTP